MVRLVLLLLTTETMYATSATAQSIPPKGYTMNPPVVAKDFPYCLVAGISLTGRANW